MSAPASLRDAAARMDELELPPARVESVAIERKPTIAIIVPTYADSRFLAAALESVRAQTYGHWRCIVVDDASPEANWPIVARFAQDDKRFLYVRHGKNAGLAAARNTGLRYVGETFVQFLDADDMLTPNALADRVAVLRSHGQDPKVAGSCGLVIQCPEETSVEDVALWRRTSTRSQMDWIQSDGESPFTVSEPLVRTSVVHAIGGFDETLVNGAEDWEFWHRILRHGFMFVSCNQVVGAYRQRRASMIRAHSAIHLRRARSLLDLAERWVTVDPAVAVGPANMPIGDARRALQRMVRAARWAGIRMVHDGFLSDSIDDDIVAFVPRGSMVATRYGQIVDAARGGLLRGLGLSTFLAREIPAATSARIEVAARTIADHLSHATIAMVDPPPGVDVTDLTKLDDPDVALVAETAADVARLVDIARELSSAGRSVVAIDVDYAKGDEGATDAWQREGVAIVPYNAVMLGTSRPSLVVARQPAGPVVLDLMNAVKQSGSAARFVVEPPRGNELEEALSASSAIETARDEDLAALAAVPPSAVRDRSVWPSSRYETQLRQEESEIDADSVRKLLELRNAHRGETAIIIGNGPSMNRTDFTLLDRAPTFGVNSIFLAEERLPAPIDYYVVEDTAVFADNVDRIKAFKAGMRLFPHIYREHFDDDEVDESTIFFRMNQGFYYPRAGNFCHPRFSADASQRVFSGQSVTIINLQLAYWMGFSRVVMIGMDFSYTVPQDAVVDGNRILSMSDDPNHFHPEYFGKGKTWKNPQLDRVLANYVLAKEIYEADGRQIINATVGGKLELFERMDLADAV